MALFHFKQEVMEEQNMKQNFNEGNNSSNIFAAKHSGEQNCGRSNPNVMFGGIDLGDIMRQTIMEEMRLIKNEDAQKLQRIGGC